MIINIEDSTNSAKQLYYQSLVLLYLPCEKFTLNDDENTLYIKAWQEDSFNNVYVRLSVGNRVSQISDKKAINNEQYADMKNFIGRTFVKCAKELFGFVPPWGISTGVKPVKLAGMFVKTHGPEMAIKILCEEYMIDFVKAKCAVDAYLNEQRILRSFDDNPCSIYVSIPFCPTKCNYCSFVSCTTPRLLSLIPEYIQKLKSELSVVKEIIDVRKLNIASIYVGGGTPAILDSHQIEDLLSHINKSFDINDVEFTFEAGRPDCITYEKLSVLNEHGVDRISINTQTTNDEILASVGRNHTYSQFCEAFEIARKVGFKCINTDLIAGLPGESCDSFRKSVMDVVSFCPENITVHAFTLKKSSQYKINGISDFSDGDNPFLMTGFASEYLLDNGYLPYYMYRQKNTIGNLDNAGYAKNNHESIYNIIMMGEYHTVFGVGAGAVTKIISDGGNKVERIFSPKYPYEFLDKDKYFGFDKKLCLSML